MAYLVDLSMVGYFSANCVVLLSRGSQWNRYVIVCLVSGALNGFSGCSVLSFLRLFFFTTFLKNCGRGECLGTTTCLKAAVGVTKGLLL